VVAFGAEQRSERWQREVRFGLRVVKRSGSVRSGAAFGAMADEHARTQASWRVKGEMNRSTSSSEIGPQGGKAQWQRSQQSSVQSSGRQAFQNCCAKGEMNRLTSSLEFLYYIRV